MFIKSYRQTAQLKNNIIIKRHVQIFKNHENNKTFYIHIEYTDIFDCLLGEKDYKVTYPATYQKLLEDGLKRGKETPIEFFSTEELPLSSERW
jgi:hypothetical protein